MPTLSKDEKAQFHSAANLMKVNGIISIIFGALGTLFSLFLVLLYAFTIIEPNEYQLTGAFISIFLVVVFGLAPHAYLIAAGMHQIKGPTPNLARGLSIASLIVGALYNWVVLVFSIINLVQLRDYEKGYKTK